MKKNFRIIKFKKNKPVLQVKSLSKSFNNNRVRSLVRFSGTEPLLRILVEAKSKITVLQKFKEIQSIVRPHLDK